MARIKSKYRSFAEGGAVNHQPVEIDTPKATITAEIVSDDASDAFQKQIDALRKAEQHVAQAATQPQHGLTPRQQAFLDQNPEMLNEPDRLGAAILRAHHQGFEPDSDQFHEAVAHNWRNHHLTVAAENAASLQHQAGTPEHKAVADRTLDRLIDDVNDKPAPKQARSRVGGGDDVPSMDDRMRSGNANMATALASRDRSSGDTAVDRYWGGGGERTTGRVTLSPAQVEAAKVSGLSLNEYAAQVLRLRDRKLAGDYGGSP